ncbi:MAG: hypothetical protein EOP12_03985 [Pseudomonas sp.]|nr:MAG: hypothetical protein EOP12_03985 [Pseudomonas sp.]
MRPRVSAVHWEGLMLDLTVHRTAAVQAVLTDNTRVVLVLVVQWMVEPIFGQLKYRTASRPLKVSATLNRHTPLSSRATEHARTVAGSDRAGSSRGMVRKRLPGQGLSTWLLTQDPAVLLELMAFGTAGALDDMHACKGVERAQVAALAEALDVDMADWWQATPATYCDSPATA